jgi:hypothetical protein
VELNHFIRTEESEREMCCGRRWKRKYGKRRQEGKHRAKKMKKK